MIGGVTILASKSPDWPLGIEISEACKNAARLSEAEIDWYVASGEGKDKAGAYAIQGLAAQFIEHIEGSYAGIMGLPLFETRQLLQDYLNQ